MTSTTIASGTFTIGSDDAWFERWRRAELARVDAAGITYLDYTGAGLYPVSLVADDAHRLAHAVLGNPHSANRASQDATRDLDAARQAVLEFLHADPAEYTVIFTPNASGALKLIGESFPFGADGPFVLTADNHNSVNGIREFARARGARVVILPIEPDLRFGDLLPALRRQRGAGLFAYPAQSNFSGVRHSLALVHEAQALGFRVLLDTAAFLPTADLDLGEVRPDFAVLSLYKIIGYPTGVGALVARRDALATLVRPWFAGGTVDWVTTEPHRHRLRHGGEGFEDGTPAYLALGAVPAALAAAVGVDRPRLRRHLRALSTRLLEGLTGLRHANGQPMVTIHGPTESRDRGATVAFSVHDAAGEVVPCWAIEEEARERGLALRSGCFCNPGCAELALALPAAVTQPCFDQLGPEFSIPKLADCLKTAQVGALRISLGAGSVARDVERVLDFFAAR